MCCCLIFLFFSFISNAHVARIANFVVSIRIGLKEILARSILYSVVVCVWSMIQWSVCALRMNRCKDCASESNCIFVWAHTEHWAWYEIPNWNSCRATTTKSKCNIRRKRENTHWNRNQNKSTYRQPNVAMWTLKTIERSDVCVCVVCAFSTCVFDCKF